VLGFVPHGAVRADGRQREIGRMTQPLGHDDVTPERKVRIHHAHNAPACSHPAAAPTSPSIENAIRGAVGEQNYQHWFQRHCRFTASGDQLVVHVPNPFILNWMLKRFRAPVVLAARQLLGPSAGCLFEVDSSLLPSDNATTSQSPPETPGARQSAETSLSHQTTALADPATAHQQALPLAQVVRSVQRRTPRNPPSTSAAPNPGNTANSSGDPVAAAARRRFRNFESLVVGECNNLAILAAKQISASPGERYNPLFVFGGTGTGKTHLLEAIYTETRRNFPKRNVMYLTSEAFTNCFTAALAARTVPSFRQRFRNVDVLLIDNIEFLDNKRATQEEFLHTIVQVSDHGGQVVISSDRHPKMLAKHREELTTRFLSGLVCRMDPPDPETGRRLLMALSSNSSAVFHNDALDYILRRCSRNIRELQGAVNQLESQFQLTGRRINAAIARDLLGGMEDECRRLVRISDVEKLVCDTFGVNAADLRSNSRRKTLAVPRAIAMFLARKLTRSAYREIGTYFGGRDHSTVVAAEKRVSQQIASNSPVGLPVAIQCRSITDLLDELERRLLAAAS
jgi:chromosomal replication initiator protein